MPVLGEASEPAAAAVAFSGRVAGAPGSGYTWFLPAGARAVHADAPVAVFFHGFASFPAPNQARRLISHYTEAGFAVLWLAMCEWGSCVTDIGAYVDNAETAYRAAYRRALDLDSPSPRSTFAAVFVAHSIGTHVAAQLASRLGKGSPSSTGPPPPRALILLDPAGYDATAGGRILCIEPSCLRGIAPDTVLLMLGARATAGASNAVRSAARLYENIPAQAKAAFIVPHACVTRRSGRIVAACPADLAECRRAYRCYISDHLAMIDPEDQPEPPPPLGPAGAAFVDVGVAVARCAIAGGGAECVTARAIAAAQPRSADLVLPALQPYIPKRD